MNAARGDESAQRKAATGAVGSPELHELLNRCVDEELTDAEDEQLTTMLLASQAARVQCIRFMQLHGHLQWTQATGAVVEDEDIVHTGLPDVRRRMFGRDRWRFVPAAIAIAAVIGLCGLVAGGLVFSFRRAAAPSVIGRLEVVCGTASFLDAAGQRSLPPQQELDFEAGTVLAEGVDAVVAVRFLDGTRVTLSGPGDLAIRSEPRKVLRLRGGVVTIDAAPQPPGLPMIMETATARLEVVGTVFSISAEPAATRVRVVEGTVRVQRLSDGSVVDVQEGNGCVATLDPHDSLRSEGSPPQRFGWRAEFGNPPPDCWTGRWLPASGSGPPRMRTVDRVGDREPNGKPFVEHVVVARDCDDGGLGMLPDSGWLAVTYRIPTAATIRIMFGLHRITGSFGGNFEAHIRPTAVDPAAHDAGWQTVRIPLGAFKPRVHRYPTIEAGSTPFFILLGTTGAQHFEVAAIAIEAGVR